MKVEIRLAKLAKEKAHKEGRSITKYVVASETGIAYNTISRYWDNDVKGVNFDVLLTLCDYFGCYLDDLLVQVPDEGDVEKLVKGDIDPELVPV